MACGRFFGLLILLVILSDSTCHAQALNNKVVAYSQARLNSRIGGGDCAHSVSEALRAAGAEFISADLGRDSPAAGDYVWGTLLKHVTYTNKVVDSKPGLKLVPGDVIQYRNARFKTSTGTMNAAHHTSIVAAVNPQGSPTFVYEQNFNNARYLKRSSIDFSTLVGGYVRVYRPKPRLVRPRQYKFSIVNNSTAPRSVTFRMNPSLTSIGSLRLDAANKLGSYLRGTVNASSSGSTIQLAINNSSVNLVNGAVYEVYTVSGQTRIRRLTP